LNSDGSENAREEREERGEGVDERVREAMMEVM
jgi:hypothetical protein